MLDSPIISIKNQTNWLMPIGARVCNLGVQPNSVHMRLDVLDASNYGVHTSSTENYLYLWLCPSFLE